MSDPFDQMHEAFSQTEYALIDMAGGFALLQVELFENRKVASDELGFLIRSLMHFHHQADEQLQKALKAFAMIPRPNKAVTDSGGGAS